MKRSLALSASTIPRATAAPADPGPGGGMMGGYGLGGLTMLLFWGAVIAGGVWIVTRLVGGTNAKPTSDALEELRLRFARGEIDEEEFQRRKAALDQ